MKKQSLTPFLTTTKMSSKHRTGTIKEKSRTALFWSNLESHPHWADNLAKLLVISPYQAKEKLIKIIRNTESTVLNIMVKKPTAQNQERIKTMLHPSNIGKILSKSYIQTEGEYVIFFSNMKVFIHCDPELRRQLDMLCDIIKTEASGKTRKTRKSYLKRKIK